ncbi:MAG TPA: kelch repeat-containing protein [Chitinophagales bacterium]|nr:kelch repeat-containing protein [Chitinophagales bacterium]
MKNLLFSCLISYVLNLISFPSNAQQGEWTWMKGSNTAAALGVLGTQGVEATANTPGATYEGAEWTDLDGNFWLFGGTTAQNDVLWKYNPATNNWTWMKGTGIYNDAGSFGTLGVPAMSNHPPARGYGAATWVGADGDLWLYGGAPDVFYKCDLWKYNIATNMWTWMSGSSATNVPAIYGTQGIPSPTNTPGSRCESSATWVDSLGNLWIFGGYKQTGAQLNDLWKYDIITNEWTWMSGSNVANAPGSYGVKGVTDPSNVPGARDAYCSWKDNSGNFWLFGGLSYNTFNDMWMYNPATNNWTWMSGTNVLSDPGHYGSLCSPSVDNIPAGRWENRARWKDACGKFWMYGGLWSLTLKYNDLWNFDPVTLEWTLANGDSLPNANPDFGTIGVSAPTNHPGARAGVVSWRNNNGDLFLFGGFVISSNSYNDLWRFVPDTTCTACNQNNFVHSNLSSSDTILCEKFCIDYFDLSTGNPVSWQWNFPGGDPSSSTDPNPVNICYDVPGVYDVTLITTSANGTDTLTLNDYITVNATPPFPVITQVGYTLTSTSATAYQWQLNSIDIPGATNQSYTILQSGYYTVVVSDSNGCVNSASIKVTISGIDEVSDANISIYPNPSSGSFVIELSGGFIADEVSIYVLNTLGQKVFSFEESRSIGINADDFSEGVHSNKKEVDLSDFASGIYFIGIKSQKILVLKKILITH